MANAGGTMPRLRRPPVEAYQATEVAILESSWLNQRSSSSSLITQSKTAAIVLVACAEQLK